MTEICYRPEYFFTLIKNDEGYCAIGSRKIAQLDIATNFADVFKDTYVQAITPEYNVNGIIYGFTVVQGPTRLAALGQLLDALDEEQRQEEDAERQYKYADINRFGGQVDEEIVRKVVRWRKGQAKKLAKQAKKLAEEKEYDPDDEWGF